MCFISHLTYIMLMHYLAKMAALKLQYIFIFIHHIYDNTVVKSKSAQQDIAAELTEKRQIKN